MKRLRRTFWRTLALHKKKKRGIPRPLKDLSFEEINRILVVSCTALGDTLLSTPAIRGVRDLFPQAQIFWLIKPVFYPLFKNNPDVDGFIFYEGGFKGLLGLVKRLANFDLVLDFHDSDEGPVIAATLAEVPFILRNGLRDEAALPFLSAKVPYREEVHAIEQRLDVVRVLIGDFSRPFDTRLGLQISPESLAFAKALLGEAAPRIGFQCKASNPYCEWPLARFEILAKHLLKRFPKGKIYLLGAQKDRKALGFADERRIINLAGKIPITHLGGVIKGLDLLVTIDTGPMHVAFAVGTPTVCLFVPSEVRHTGPYQDLSKHRVIRKERPCSPCSRKYCKDPWCMELIPVEEVLAACEEALS